MLCLEATGAYTRLLISEALALDLPVALLNARHVRNYARAAGRLAKTDELDALIISAYAKAFPPQTLSKKWTQQEQLHQYLLRLDFLVESAARLKASLDYYQDQKLQRDIKRHIAAEEKRIKAMEKAVDALLEQNELLVQKRALIEKVTGVGEATSRRLVITVPELGTLNRQQAAALMGLAPMNRDSGAGRGKRCIQAGRAKPRKALYMAALTAAYRNEMFKPFYQSLKAKGKPSKVALIAVARKLLIYLNTLCKEVENPQHTATLKT